MTRKKNPFEENENIENTENLTQEETENIEENKEASDEKLDNTSENNDDNDNNAYKEKYEALNNQYIRLAADFDNFRKRTEAQKTELINMGLENALIKMIEVLDNFDRAKKAMEGINDCEAALKGFDVLYNQVFENLKKLGLEIINTKNEKFDPNFHEAVMQTPNNEVEDQTILNELQKGYKFKDKVLRPTLVNVAVNS